MALATSRWPLEILLVEDNLGDVELTLEAFACCDVDSKITVKNDGVDALEHLTAIAENAKRHLPALILLDLNMPRMDGRELLVRLKETPALRSIPVVILSTSRSDNDIARMYDLHANCFLTKPVDFDEFAVLVDELQRFWLSTAKLPRN